jgi:photosystem II stability/assembly factor-like uncharacterized protein
MGEYGTFISSTNGGVNWNVSNKTSGLTGRFDSYFIFNQSTYFVGTSDAKLIKTVDYGKNWSVLYDFHLYYTEIRGIDFRSSITGYVIAGGNSVLKTTNLGANWTNVFYNSAASLEDIEFVSPNIGFIANGDQKIKGPNDYDIGIIMTTNGGVNWSQVFSISTGYIQNMRFLNSTTGYFTCNNNFYKTTNQGLNWSQMGNTYKGTLRNVYILNDLRIYATYDANDFVSTTDGGYTWSERDIPVYGSMDMKFQNFTDGYILSWDNLIYKCSNAQDEWGCYTERSGSGSASDVLYNYYFLNDNTGFVVGANAMIKKTTDNGESWTKILSPSTSQFYDIDFINANTGFIAGAGYPGILLKSIDGGSSWNISNSFGSSGFKCIKFFDELTGLLATESGEIYRTSDGGNSWNMVDNSLYYSFGSITIKNTTTAFATGSSGLNLGKILRTTDSGLTWAIVANPVAAYKLKFIDENIGYCTGLGVLKTTDGGDTWNKVLNNNSTYGIDFINANTGIITGNAGYDDGGFVYKTTDGGNLWNGLDFPTGNNMYAVKFFNANTGLIFGENGTILKTYNGGGNYITGVSGNENSRPSEYKLFQNYPNPFNPGTKIKFQITASTQRNTVDVKLKVYNILGNEIATLVNNKMQPGIYEVQFNANQLPSGVYFYKLTAGNYSETKKMMLIK